MAGGKACVVCHKKNISQETLVALPCLHCGKWFHTSCSKDNKLNECDAEEILVLQRYPTSCPVCFDSFKNLNIRMDKLENYMELLQKRLDRNVSVATNYAENSSTPSNSTKNVSNSSIETANGHPTAPTDVNEKIKEAIACHENKSTIVIAGISETNDPDEDKNIFNDICATLDLQGVTAVEVYRLGKFNADAAKPRLLRVKLLTPTQRAALLRMSKTLRIKDRFKNVFVRPSHTCKERQIIKNLYLQIEEIKRSNPNENAYIERRGEVCDWSVKTKRSPTSAQ